ncbi:MAG: RsmB/NOP family class I SAM-dependent RNA methyltransferase [bacterium]
MPNYHLPEKLQSRLRSQFGAQTTDEIVRAFSIRRESTFRVNTLKTDDTAVMAELREQRIAFSRIQNLPHAFKVRDLSERDLLKLELCTSGKIYLQGLSSMLPALLLDPKPGEKVLDLCAAPGSKTSQLAMLMQNQGSLIALEKDEIRFQKLQKNLALLGVKNCEARQLDASLVWKELENFFDKVLADVPCSAEGRIDLKEPRTFSFWSEKRSTVLAKEQRRLLRSAVRCLKAGGELVYSTCTLSPLENELMIEWLLREFPELRLQKISLALGRVRDTKFGLVVLPSAEMEGFFVAKLKKYG